MTNPAIDIDSIIESEANFEDQADCEIIELDVLQRDSLSDNFHAELDAWARHCIAANGFGDY